MLHSLLGQLLGLHAVSLREAVGSDAAFALLLMGSLQVGTFFVVHSSLRAVRQALRRASTGAELSAAAAAGARASARRARVFIRAEARESRGRGSTWRRLGRAVGVTLRAVSCLRA